jgi:hypothetical protein
MGAPMPRPALATSRNSAVVEKKLGHDEIAPRIT